MNIDEMKEAIRDLEWQELSITGRAALDVLRKAISEAEDALAAEREACAKVCDSWQDSFELDTHGWYASGCCANEIRARGEK